MKWKIVEKASTGPIYRSSDGSLRVGHFASPGQYEKLRISEGLAGNAIVLLNGQEVWHDVGLRSKEEAIDFLTKYKKDVSAISPEIKEFVEKTYKAVTEEQGAKK